MTKVPENVADFLYDLVASIPVTEEELQFQFIQGGTGELEWTRDLTDRNEKVGEIVFVVDNTIATLNVAVVLPEQYTIGLTSIVVRLLGPKSSQISYLENDGSASFDLEEDGDYGDYIVGFWYDEDAPVRSDT